MRKVIDWIYELKTDKLLHFIAGALVAEIVIGMLCHWISFFALLVGLAASIFVGLAKEWYDSNHEGVVSKCDFFATLAGGIAGTVVMLIMLL